MASLKNFKAELKTKYNRYLKISIILSLSILIAAFKYFPGSFDHEKHNPQTQELINIEEIISTIQKPEIPPPPKQPAIIEASPDDLSEDVILNDIDIFHNEPIDLPPPPRPEITAEPEIFIWTEVMPEPIGGLASIQSKVKYTEIAKRIGLEGRVIVEAIIDQQGIVIEAIIIKSLGGGLDESALNAVKETKFSPGIQRGKPVKVRMKIPIKFVLR